MHVVLKESFFGFSSKSSRDFEASASESLVRLCHHIYPSLPFFKGLIQLHSSDIFFIRMFILIMTKVLLKYCVIVCWTVYTGFINEDIISFISDGVE